MKQLNFTLLMIVICLSSFAQQSSFPGYRSGNFTGVNGVFFNPAAIADSRYRWDFNLVSVNAGIGNNKASYKLKEAINNFDTDDLKNKLVAGSGRINANVNADVFGPSVMFNVSPKNSFALTTRLRTVATVRNLDGPLAQAIIDASNDINLPYTINSTQASKVNVNGWSEFGLSYGRVITDNGQNFFKGGITLKYLAGVGNTYVQISNLNTTITEDAISNAYLAQGTTGSVAIGVGGANVTTLDADQITEFNGNGIGADIGFEYEWRPNADKYKMGDNSARRDVNKYKLKIGVALLDFGKIKYKRDQQKSGAYNLNVQAGDRFNLSQLDDKELDEYKDVLESPANNPRYFTTTAGSTDAEYKVSLPTTVQINADLNLNRGFYVNLGGQIAFDKEENIPDPAFYSGITLTPRYEGKAFGFYIPLNYNALTDFNAGVSLRAGPLFLGSGSIITALTGKTKQADVHVGLRFGILHKKKKEPVAVAEPEPVYVAPVDSDSDGIIDSLDKCPTVPGLAKYDGCPVPDTDADGVNDEEDKCVNVAGVARYQGCPIPDTDNDGVNDEEDKCPNQAGPASNFGCPVIDVVIVEKVNKAASNIFFATGSAKLLAKSYTSLKNVAQILKDNTSYKIDIDGYTDITGSAEKNQVLSENRAASVKEYLQGNGIEESRIVSTGHGIDDPIADNKTAAGRAKNRRVEMKLRNY